MPRHIVCLTFDFDTQSGFIARGMTTPTPLSRGEFGAIGVAADSRFPQGARHQGDLVHSRLYHRELAAGMRGRGRGRARSRAPQLGAYSARDAEPRGGGGRSRARQRGHRALERAQGARLPLAVLGLERAHHRSAARARLPLRFEPDGRRLSALSRAPRRRRQARRAVSLRRGDPADRNADQLVARRLSAFRVRAHAGDHPRRPAAGARGDGRTGSTNSST